MSHSIPEIPVLYFHSIAPKKHTYWSRNYLTLELMYFEEFLKYLNRNRWKTIFLDEYYHIRNTGEKAPKRTCCITFDDGFLDNYIYGYPLLKKYGHSATIFINPDFIDLKRRTAYTLEDYWNNVVDFHDLNIWGYLTWDELNIMQKSGVIDIQSHTLTHTKYFVSDEVVSFHHPGGDCLYPIGNLHPARKPYYMMDVDFEKLLKYGTPFFKSASSIIAQRVFINQAFENVITELLRNFDWEQSMAKENAMEKVSDEYYIWKRSKKIIENVETEIEQDIRLHQEISGSKMIIEKKLNKKVEFLCWPHGENNEKVHQLALESGYLATTTGSKQKLMKSPNRISIRTGIGVVNNNIFLTNLKTRYRMSISSGNITLKALQKTFHLIK